MSLDEAVVRRLTAVAILLLAGCGGGAASASTEVPSQYAGAIRSEDTATGQARYEAICRACHDDTAPALEGITWEPAQMRRQVREGSGEMPPVSTSHLSDDDLEAVLAHMVTTGAVER